MVKMETEGCRYKNTIGTYLHGPLFSKNPELCDELLETALKFKIWSYYIRKIR